MSDPVLPPDAIDAICRHMNEDHAEDSLLIVRALGDRPAAEQASMSGLDEHAAIFDAVVDGAAETVRVPWSEPLASRAQVRAEVVVMYQRACQALGIEPRPAAEH
jgi:putative heme iron utilization protein